MRLYKSPSDIRCAVIGYGGAFNMGRQHLAGMQAAGLRPHAVAEVATDRLAVASTDFPGIQTFSSVDQMLAVAQPDLVTIITPHNTHAALATACLQAGAHVVCEKPMAITVAECDAMIELARQRGLLLSVYHNRHWDGRIMRAVEQIGRQRVIGDVFRVEAHMGGFAQPGDWWRSSRSISGGIHYDWGVHLVEYALQLIDSEVVEVSGFFKEGTWTTAWGADTIEDEVSVIVRFRNGVLFNLRITHTDAKGDPDWLVITGTSGVYTFNATEYALYQKYGDEALVRRGRNPSDDYPQYYGNIAAALTGTADLIITPEWSRRTMEILDLGIQSARQNRAIRIRE